MENYDWIRSIRIRGYRPFDDVAMDFDSLHVIVGAHGSGKSSLFEFLQFIRDACYREIPPEIVEGSTGRQIFHKPGPDRLWWSAEFDLEEKPHLFYQGELVGPIGST